MGERTLASYFDAFSPLTRVGRPRAVAAGCLELAPGAAAVLLTAFPTERTLWTADGRRHDDVPGLTLSGVHQLRRRTRGTPRYASARAPAAAV